MNPITVLAETAAAARRPKRLWLLQLAANPVLFGMFVLWLLLPEARAIHLIASAILIVIVVLGTVALHAGTLNALLPESAGKRPFRLALSHTLSIAAWAVIFYLLWSQVDRLEPYQYSLPSFLRAEIPRWLRNLVSERLIDGAYSAFLFLLRWVLLPGLATPFLLLCAERGRRAGQWTSIKLAFGSWGTLHWWLQVALCAVLGVWLPSLLMNWFPFAKTPGLSKEALSLLVRLGASYILCVAAWMLLAAGLTRALSQSPGPVGQSTA
jgi:hypothetical protein